MNLHERAAPGLIEDALRKKRRATAWKLSLRTRVRNRQEARLAPSTTCIIRAVTEPVYCSVRGGLRAFQPVIDDQVTSPPHIAAEFLESRGLFRIVAKVTGKRPSVASIVNGAF